MNDGGRERSVWVLGATGRIGRPLAALLAERGCAIGLVGRNPGRLRQLAQSIGSDVQLEVICAETTEDLARLIVDRRPSVVINALGRYAETAEPIARACMPGGHYLDLAIDLTSMMRTLELHDEAVRGGSLLVTGAGFGVLATEAVVMKMCANRPVPATVRVDALASVAIEPGLMGAAFAATTVDVLVTGGRRYRRGRLTASRLGSGLQVLRLPDGQTARSVAVPSGELIAAQRASGAPDVIATSALGPTAPVVRAFLPVIGALLSSRTLQEFAIRQLARVPLKATPRPRANSWGHAVVTWQDGKRAEAWLRTGDGMVYTIHVLAAIVDRLLEGRYRAGAYTPGSAFGAELATAAGGEFID